MRFAFALLAVATAAFAGAASAQTIEPISFTPEFQQKLDDDLGAREGEYLRDRVMRRVSAELAARGIANDPGRIEISIIDAQPNRPTLQQASDTPGLDMFRSVSIGGAELHAVLRDANGQVVSEVDHRFYTHSLDDVFAPTTWTDASRSIDRFARKVADAYAETR